MDSRVNQEHSNFAMFYWGYFNEMIHKFPSKILLLLPWGESSLWVNCVHFPKGGFLHAIIIIYLYCMVRNKEVLFPPHEYVVSFLQLLIVEAVWVEIFTVLTEGQEFSLEKYLYCLGKLGHWGLYPMLFIHIFIRVPFSGEEWMFFTDYFSVKESDHLWVLVSQVLDLQVPAQVGRLLVDVLERSQSSVGIVYTFPAPFSWSSYCKLNYPQFDE